jgi:hypothetical protein
MKYLTFLDYSTLETTDINIETKLYKKRVRIHRIKKSKSYTTEKKTVNRMRTMMYNSG